MKTKMNTLLAAALLSLGLGSAIAASHTEAPAAAAVAKLTAGEVRKVDNDQGKVTIKHEAIKNLDMPPMTMVFRAEKPELLKNLKAGDKIRFQAQSVAGAFVVTRIEAAK